MRPPALEQWAAEKQQLGFGDVALALERAAKLKLKPGDAALRHLAGCAECCPAPPEPRLIADLVGALRDTRCGEGVGKGCGSVER